MDYEQFQLVHSHLLKQVPPLYWETLYRKLTKEVSSRLWSCQIAYRLGSML
jgi:hypothetical protein